MNVCLSSASSSPCTTATAKLTTRVAKNLSAQKDSLAKKAKERKEMIKSLLAKRTTGKKEIASEQGGNNMNSTLLEPMEELHNNVEVADVAQKHHETTKVSMEDPTRSAERRNISTQWMSLMKLPQQSGAKIGKPKRLKSPLNAEKQHETSFSMEDPTRSASTSLRPRPTESLPKKLRLPLQAHLVLHPAKVQPRCRLLKPRQKSTIILALNIRRNCH